MRAEVLRAASAHVLVDDVATPALSDDDAHHVFRVLRVRPGETVTVTDGAGRWRACRAADRLLEPVGEIHDVPRRARPLTLACTIPKQDRPEWIVQKLVELGVDRIVWLHAERSVVRWNPERAERHLAKLRRVAAEALQQSRGVWLPEITGPVSTLEVLPSAAAAEPGSPPIGAGDTIVAIGPEGGWSPSELTAAASTVSFGDTVLRVETAAIVAAARMVMHAE
ncbi:MAG: RsmE family RNA methyltransferase [Ilumatobacteraceae bacterium]|nr:RsmE family RNA methyltransferase [Ilumatobacteraceae bacterium]